MEYEGSQRCGVGLTLDCRPDPEEECRHSELVARLRKSTAMNSRIVAAFVSRMHSMISLPELSLTATEIVAW
jgi:hypothetical protein